MTNFSLFFFFFFFFFWKTLLTDIWQQRKVEEVAAARRLSPAKNRKYRCCKMSVNSENSGISLLPDRHIFLSFFFHKCIIWVLGPIFYSMWELRFRWNWYNKTMWYWYLLWHSLNVFILVHAQLWSGIDIEMLVWTYIHYHISFAQSVKQSVILGYAG